MFKTLSIFLCLLSAEIKAQVTTQSLEYYLKTGLQNSPLLKDYQNRIGASSVDSLLVGSAQAFKIDANAQAMYAPVYKNFGYDEAITNGGNYSGVVGISHNLLNYKELKNKYADISIQNRALQNTLKISRNEAIRIITDQYLSAYSVYSNLLFNRNFLKLLNGQKEILRKLIESGIYKQTDYLSLMIELQAQEIAVTQQTNEYEKDILLLNQLCGIEDLNPVELSLPDIHIKDLANPALSPLFFQYKLDSLKITNDKRAIDVRYCPKLNWFADAGFMAANPSTIDRHFGYSTGINFNVPIYDGKQRKFEYQKLGFSENTRTNYESFFKRQFHQQILQLNREIKATQETLEQQKKQAATAEELMSMMKSLMNTGNISITEFINATKNYNAINKEINQSQIKILQLINELNYWMQQ